MKILSYIISGFLILFWLIFLNTGRKNAIAGIVRGSGGVMPNTVFQLNILPIFTALLLFLTGNILFLLLSFVLFYISRLSISLSYIFSFALSALIGFKALIFLGIEFKFSWLISILAGLLLGQVFCSIILNYVTGEDIKKKIYDKSKLNNNNEYEDNDL